VELSISSFRKRKRTERDRDTLSVGSDTGWLRFVGSLNLQVSFAKEPYKRYDILQKRPAILRSLLIVGT